MVRRAELIVHELHRQWRESYASDVQAALAEAGGKPDKPKVPAPWDNIRNQFFRPAAPRS